MFNRSRYWVNLAYKTPGVFSERLQKKNLEVNSLRIQLAKKWNGCYLFFLFIKFVKFICSLSCHWATLGGYFSS